MGRPGSPGRFLLHRFYTAFAPLSAAAHSSGATGGKVGAAGLAGVALAAAAGGIAGSELGGRAADVAPTVAANGGRGSAGLVAAGWDGALATGFDRGTGGRGGATAVVAGGGAAARGPP